MLDLSIIIVTYNSENDIYPCLQSLILSNTKVNYEIIIVDNGSKDNTCKIVNNFILQNSNKKIKLIKGSNKGFNAGNNTGINNSAGEFILLLNPDTEVFPNTLENLFNTSKKIKNMGSLGCVMVNKENQVIFSAGYFPSIISVIKKYIKKNQVRIHQNKELQLVDFPAGSTFMFRKSIITKIGLMDENYFLYFDETDYAYQMKKVGLQSYILTNTKVIHKFGQSTTNIPKFSIEKNIESFFYFINKNYNKFYGFLIKCFDLTFHLTRYSLSNIYKKHNKELFKFYVQTYILHFKRTIKNY
ncbi:glycosyltransferase family 2 protein [Gottfriedia sp. NPDC057991]|uniref:glycosyltransferase family 2 protein n=1 Tax=Gottfriedia sp. NPDC057991 TaxID=3346298 RepID=UPI0036D95184